jgi:hypothetical protein
VLLGLSSRNVLCCHRRGVHLDLDLDLLIGSRVGKKSSSGPVSDLPSVTDGSIINYHKQAAAPHLAGNDVFHHQQNL